MIKIADSDLFVVLGKGVEPWVNKLVASSKLDSAKLVQVSDGITLKKHHHDLDGIHHDEDIDEDISEEDSHKDKNHNEHEDGLDPHIWLDPVLAQKIVRNIEKGYIRVSPKDSLYFKKNADTLVSKLEELNKRFIATFDSCRSKTIMYAGHFAFGYFADRYNLKYVSPYSGFSPNAEPSPSKIAELINKIKEDTVSTIFYEELIEPRVAKTISKEANVKMALLHGIHNVSSKELLSSFSYLKGMEENRVKLQEGLK
jgi:zinc transport system substrate-binding protein